MVRSPGRKLDYLLSYDCENLCHSWPTPWPFDHIILSMTLCENITALEICGIQRSLIQFAIHKISFRLLCYQCASLHDKVRITYPITTKRYSFIALVLVITWLDYGNNLSKIIIFGKFCLKISDVFFQGQKLFWPYLRNGCSIHVKRKGNASVGYWVQYLTLTFLPHSWPWLWIFQGQISK